MKIAFMNDIKELGEVLAELVSRLRATEDIDQRWVSISATDLQTGLMALTRAVARPDLLLMTTIDIELDDREVRRALRRIAGALADPWPAMRAIATHLADRAEDAFETQASPGGIALAGA